MLSNCIVKKMQGQGFAYMLTFAFMHHPYLVCILFGMPSLHLFTFLMFFIFFIITYPVSHSEYCYRSHWKTQQKMLCFYNCVSVNFAPTRTDFQQVPGGETEYLPAYYDYQLRRTVPLFSSYHIFFCVLFSILVTIIPCRVRRQNNAKKDNSNGGKYDNESDAGLFLCEHTNTNDAVGNHCAL